MSLLETPRVRCAIYTRKSTEDGLEQDFNSLDAQREAGEAYIISQRANGWTCVDDRYDDGGYTGGNVDRPAFQRLLADVEAGRVDCIVVYKIDRLSRSLMDFARIMQALERHNASLVSVTQQFNTTSSMGRLTLNILLSFAQFEREIVSERTRDKMAAARRKGKWTGGAQLLGYDLLRETGGTKLVVNKAEAERVRETFRIYLAEGSMLPTLKELKRRGWRSKQYQTLDGRRRGGMEISKSTLQKLLTNVAYLGKTTYKGEIHEGEHEAIVDEELFGQVQGLLKRNLRSGGKFVRNKYAALLKGLVRCKHCGCGMSHHFATRGNKRYRYYVCMKAQKQGWNECPTPSIPAKELEDFVVEQIKGLGSDDALLDESMRKTQEHLQTEIDVLEGQRAEVERLIKGVGREVGTLASRAGYDDEATRDLARLQERMKEDRREVTRINERIVGIRRRMLNSDELAGAIEAFDPLWDRMPPTQRAKLVHLLVDRIEHDGVEQEVSITFHPTGIKALTQQAEETASCR